MLRGSDTRSHQGQSIRPGGQARFNPPVLHVLPGILAQHSGEDSRRRGVSCRPPTARTDRRSLPGATLRAGSCPRSGWRQSPARFRGWKKGSDSLLSLARREIQAMSQTTQERNKALVLEAFDGLFNRRDYAAAERFWSPGYVQHSAHIAPGREGLFDLVRSLPPTLKYEPGVIVADGDFVIVHGRFSGFGAPVNWIAADILRIQDGILVEHWDVIQ